MKTTLNCRLLSCNTHNQPEKMHIFIMFIPKTDIDVIYLDLFDLDVISCEYEQRLLFNGNEQ